MKRDGMNTDVSIYELLAQYKIIPVIKIQEAENALPTADALCRGGLPVAEITFRTQCAEEVISILSSSRPDMTVGAGTVLTCEQAECAINAGADFIVAPGLNTEVVKYCQHRRVTVIPGCVTPTEIESALALGINVIKFFPAAAYGGVSTIKALSAPYSGVKFLPTGGVSLQNLREYTECGAVIACGGSFMASESMISGAKWDEIERMTRRAVAAASGIESI